MSEIVTLKDPQSVIRQLSEPFDTELLFWKPQSISRDKTKAMGAVYCDPRAYTDRLNEAVGPYGWSENYVFTTCTYSKESYKTQAVLTGSKVICVATITINGLGSHSSSGESDAADENAATSAEAQALKRACYRFGLGRYLYRFPKKWYPWDDTKRQFATPPEIPDWAQPTRYCTDCKEVIEPYAHNNRMLSVTEIIARSEMKYNRMICAECQIKLNAVKAGS